MLSRKNSQNVSEDLVLIEIASLFSLVPNFEVFLTGSYLSLLDESFCQFKYIFQQNLDRKCQKTIQETTVKIWQRTNFF